MDKEKLKEVLKRIARMAVNSQNGAREWERQINRDIDLALDEPVALPEHDHDTKSVLCKGCLDKSGEKVGVLEDGRSFYCLKEPSKTEHKHCWDNSHIPLRNRQDHGDCETCCSCHFPFQSFGKEPSKETEQKTETLEQLEKEIKTWVEGIKLTLKVWGHDAKTEICALCGTNAEKLAENFLKKLEEAYQKGRDDMRAEMERLNQFDKDFTVHDATSKLQ